MGGLELARTMAMAGAELPLPPYSPAKSRSNRGCALKFAKSGSERAQAACRSLDRTLGWFTSSSRAN